MTANGMLRSKMYALLLTMISSAQISVSSAFLSPNADRIRSTHSIDHRHLREIPTSRCAAANDQDPKEDESESFAALPPIGASSFWDRPQDENTYANNAKNSESNGIIISEHANLVSAKFKIQYTCKVCSTRNSHSVTRIAYRNGVVIAQCKGCPSKHLIADNLGWSNYIGGFDFDNGERNIETYMENREQEARENGMGGEEVNDLVMRVNRDVFDLETILYKGKEENVLSVKGAEEDDQVEDESSWS
eukprot:CAMPEP_0201866110 /NCGR_PEP_ID=MMETSP0902-20130614/795_1 /ASSEMBLY_ACC=CAM_ASM_000551 /TAXON_ID=420261 /ORGANISM="Thalassiosira antarctica, Strain CCMP982" /LENGTH=247 /DNA_ID=CAMNT_0048391011 /DNA_START=44 /DNA_END=787 /DNA_ORIENTATION=+